MWHFFNFYAYVANFFTILYMLIRVFVVLFPTLLDIPLVLNSCYTIQQNFHSQTYLKPRFHFSVLRVHTHINIFFKLLLSWITSQLFLTYYFNTGTHRNGCIFYLQKEVYVVGQFDWIIIVLIAYFESCACEIDWFVMILNKLNKQYDMQLMFL